MRFNVPENGDLKIIKKFLLFPLVINNEGRILEYAYILVKYRDRGMRWVPLKFVTKEEYLKYKQTNIIEF